MCLCFVDKRVIFWESVFVFTIKGYEFVFERVYFLKGSEIKTQQSSLLRKRVQNIGYQSILYRIKGRIFTKKGQNFSNPVFVFTQKGIIFYSQSLFSREKGIKFWSQVFEKGIKWNHCNSRTRTLQTISAGTGHQGNRSRLSGPAICPEQCQDNRTRVVSG